MGARQTGIGMPAHTQTLSGPFSRSEKLMFHMGVFLIGGWNLFIINLSRSPHHLWFWPWMAGWAALLLVHCGTVLWARFASAALPDDGRRHPPRPRPAPRRDARRTGQATRTGARR